MEDIGIVCKDYAFLFEKNKKPVIAMQKPDTLSKHVRRVNIIIARCNGRVNRFYFSNHEKLHFVERYTLMFG